MFERQKKIETPKTIKFQVVDWQSSDISDKDEEEESIYSSDDSCEFDEDGEPIFKKKKSQMDTSDFNIRLYGVTEEGYSVSVSVTDFKPYFFIKVSDDWKTRDTKNLVNAIRELVYFKHKDNLIDYDVVKRKDLYGFTDYKLFNFVKLTFRNYGAMCSYNKVFSKPIKIKSNKTKFRVYEYNLHPMLRFSHVRDISPSGWVRIKKFKTNRHKNTHCQIDVTAKWSDVKPSKKTGIAPLLIASFDIECTSIDGTFPDPERPGDKIIQIATTFHRYGSSECHLKHITTLKKCNAIKGAIVESHKTERELLISWAKFIQQSDPDIITGYNIWGFDFKYLYIRSKKKGCESRFMNLGKNIGIPSKFVEKQLSSSAMGDNFLKYIDMEGRVQIDLLKLVQRDYKLTSYKLDNVAEHFLKKKKLDIKPSQIFEYFTDGRAKKITEIAKYCIMDCVLCNELIIKLDVIPNNIGMSNVCIVPLSYLFLRGQGIKIFSLVVNQCRKEKTLVPVVKKDYNKSGPGDDEGYEGAIVLTPHPGIYFEPIVVVDYASLYPSSIIAENISHDTYVTDPKYDNLPGYTYNTVKYDIYEGKDKDKHKVGEKICRFAEKKGDKGTIPRILQSLLQARKDSRRKIKYKTLLLKNGIRVIGSISNESKDSYTILDEDKKEIVVEKSELDTIEDTYDAFKKSMFNGLQLAFKVTANSLYGQMGASTSPIFFKELAASTTAVGRDMLITAKVQIEKNFEGTKCIYGDTDSCFLAVRECVEKTYNIRLEDDETKFLEKVWEIGEKAGNLVSSMLKKPQYLEMEKIFYPFCLFSKKRYVSNKFDNPKDLTKFKIDSMGILLKRRDNCPVAKDIYGGIIDIILNEKDIKKATKFYQDSVESLLAGKISIDKLVISKSIRAEYADPTKIAHKMLAHRMAERDPANAPASNDRIPYVYIDPKQLKCEICYSKLNLKDCKCIGCMHLFCNQHIHENGHVCDEICRKCFASDKKAKLEQCDICGGTYCDKHTIKSDNPHKCSKNLSRKLLQGDQIETPDFVNENELKIDYRYYYDHQLKKPIEQIFNLVMKDKTKFIMKDIIRKDTNRSNKTREITNWFKVS